MLLSLLLACQQDPESDTDTGWAELTADGTQLCAIGRQHALQCWGTETALENGLHQLDPASIGPVETLRVEGTSFAWVSPDGVYRTGWSSVGAYSYRTWTDAPPAQIQNCGGAHYLLRDGQVHGVGYYGLMPVNLPPVERMGCLGWELIAATESGTTRWWGWQDDESAPLDPEVVWTALGDSAGDAFCGLVEPLGEPHCVAPGQELTQLDSGQYTGWTDVTVRNSVACAWNTDGLVCWDLGLERYDVRALDHAALLADAPNLRQVVVMDEGLCALFEDDTLECHGAFNWLSEGPP